MKKYSCFVIESLTQKAHIKHISITLKSNKSWLTTALKFLAHRLSFSGVAFVQKEFNAIRATWEPQNNRDIIDATRMSSTPAFMEKDANDVSRLMINGIDGSVFIEKGIWVIDGGFGEFFLCSDEEFKKTYF